MYGKSNVAILPTNVPLKDLPEVFNQFFISKISKIRSALDTQNIEVNGTCQSVFARGKFSNFKPLSESEVKTIILSSPAKSCSLDPIPTQILCQHIDVLIESITTIVN